MMATLARLDDMANVKNPGFGRLLVACDFSPLADTA